MVEIWAEVRRTPGQKRSASARKGVRACAQEMPGLSRAMVVQPLLPPLYAAGFQTAARSG